MSKNKKGIFGRLFRKTATNEDFQKTEMSKELKDAIHDIEKYEDIISNLNRAFLLFMQPSKTDCPELRGHQECEDTLNNSTALAVKISFGHINQIWNRADIKEHAEYALYYTYAATKEFQKAGRRRIGSIRDFVIDDFERFKELKTKLDASMKAIDTADSQLKDAKTGEVIPAKQEVYDEACDVFDSLSEEIMAFHGKLEKYESEHFTCIIKFFKELEKYQLDAVKALAKVSALKAKTETKAASTGKSPAKEQSTRRGEKSTRRVEKKAVSTPGNSLKKTPTKK